ncbi:MAG: hypothetical protein AVO39_08205 [delta proteobacterium MLS_D]|nr:MAG: hypothetical protein AVO39_08205 [delta proteobacterium MLS_D]
MMKPGTLYIVATPIGNLEDISIRAIRVLREVDLIAAEDTRRTKILLKHHSIGTRLTSFHDHNEREKTPLLIAKLFDGSDVACVSDAGTPGVSDPGYLLVKEAAARGIDVVAVPGPSALVSALSVSGLPMDSFVFHGFPPSRSARRRRFFESLAGETKTMVFFESPMRIQASLRDMLEIFGDRDISLSRELTKLHEETRRGHIGELVETLEHEPPKGEITLVVAGRETATPRLSPDEIWSRYTTAIAGDAVSTRDAVAAVARETGMPKREIYEIVLIRSRK